MESSLANVFKDAEKHLKIADIITRHISNKSDIRIFALNGLDISKCQNILDLGCGYGFFTEALRGKVHPKVKVTGVDRFTEYEKFFSQSAEKAGVSSNFLYKGISVLEKMESNSYDLILCSYALYFFPEMVAHISRILKDDGLFVAITHAIPHMHEFADYVRKILREEGHNLDSCLPYEKLIKEFSDKNGYQILTPYFSKISKKKYEGVLIFGAGDYEDLIHYFNFKHSFFIPEEIDADDKLHQMIIRKIKRDMGANQELRITKNDVIFVSSGPKV